MCSRTGIETHARCCGVIDREPLLISAFGWSDVSPVHAAVGRAPHVIEECLEQTEIEEVTGGIGIEHGVTAKDIVLEHAGKGPGGTGIGGVTPAGLTKVRSDAVELSPANGHFVSIVGVDRNRWLIGRVAGNVLSTGINIHLDAGEGVVLRDHRRRYARPRNVIRRIVIFFQLFGRQRPEGCLAGREC